MVHCVHKNPVCQFYINRLHSIYTVSQKTRRPLVTIISSNLNNRFSNFFHCRKAC